MPLHHAARVVVALALIAAGATVASCNSSSGEASSSTFTYALGEDPGSLDPAGQIGLAGLTVLSYAYDTLIDYDARGGHVPRLATRWDVTATSIVFRMRKGVTCSDGSAVTPTVVAKNFDYVTDPDNGSPLLGILPPDVRATADDAAGTVKIATKAPSGLLLDTAGGLVQIVCGKGLRDRALLKRGTSGSGPYVLVEAASNNRYALKRRKAYDWGPGGATTGEPGQPERVVLQVIANNTTAANLLLSSKLSGARLTGPELKRLRQRDELTEHSVLDSIMFTFLNQAPGRPGADPAVRRAFATAFDRGELARVVTDETGEPAEGFLSGLPRVCDDTAVGAAIPGFDPAAARQSLDEAGWRPGADGIREKNGKPLVLGTIYDADETTQAAAAELITRAAREIGARIEREPLSATAHSKNLLETGNWDFAPFEGIGTPMPNAFYGLFTGPRPPDGSNFANIQNAEYIRLGAQANRTPGQKGCELWTQAETALVTGGDVTPMIATSASYFAAEGVEFELGSGGVNPLSIRLPQD